MAAAAAAATLDDLRAAIAAFDGCALRDTASHLVFAEGDPSADLLLIGEPPGADEDRGGTPFAGLGGAYLDRMLASIGLERSRLMLAPLIPWRPPGDRPPSPTELAICLPFLHRLIALLGPRRIVLFGALPARALLPQTASRRRPRGAWIDAPIPGVPQSIADAADFQPGGADALAQGPAGCLGRSAAAPAHIGCRRRYLSARSAATSNATTAVTEGTVKLPN